MVYINLGCGGRKRFGFVNIDIDGSVRPDRIVDINKRLPFESGSVEHVLMDNVLEHLDESGVKEVWRVLKSGGSFKVFVPHYLSRHAFNSFEHKHWFNVNTFYHSTVFEGFRVHELKVWYCFGRFIKFSLPVWFVRLHERLLPGLLPPTHMEVLLIKR